MAAGDVEHVGRLTQARDPPAQRSDQRLALAQAGPELGRALGEVAVVEVVGFDPELDEPTKQALEHLGVGVDPPEQHGLGEHRDPGVDQARARSRGGGGQLAGVVGVQDHVDGGSDVERVEQGRVDPAAVDDRDPSVDADDPDVLDRVEGDEQAAELGRGQDQWVAAAEDDLPDLSVLADVGEGRVELGLAEDHGAARVGPDVALGADLLAAEAEPAVDRAHSQRLEQHAIGVTVDHARDRGVDAVPDRVAELLGPDLELAGVGHELGGDRVVGIVGVDQLDQLLGDRRGEAGDDALDRDQIVRADQPARAQLGGGPQAHAWRSSTASGRAVCPSRVIAWGTMTARRRAVTRGEGADPTCEAPTSMAQRGRGPV